MTRLTWSNPADRTFETGLDRGVLYLNNLPAVPWNGLTGVDENGGEDVVTYYLDGRPFLNVPKPKEFSGTINAYTYPNEFSYVLGLVEAVSGFYVDSQMGDSFHLSYRTLIGDAVNGNEAGHKIHLIYNATIVPSQISYASLSSEINPVEFSWDIQAVPVPMAGYRPSAHYIIDTRKLFPDILAALEALLYGNDDTVAHMPDPKTIFDLIYDEPTPNFVGIIEPMLEPLTDYGEGSTDGISDFIQALV